MTMGVELASPRKEPLLVVKCSCPRTSSQLWNHINIINKKGLSRLYFHVLVRAQANIHIYMYITIMIKEKKRSMWGRAWEGFEMEQLGKD